MLKKVGILGFGALGQHLYDSIAENSDIGALLDVVFVWNRSADALERVPEELRLANIEDCSARGADVVVEVCHPSVSARYAVPVMQVGADFVVGSPTALADSEIESAIRSVANSEEGGSLYIPVGALWGASDLQSAASRNLLVNLTLTMKKHPAMLNLTDPEINTKRRQLVENGENGSHQGEVILYEGPVRSLCPLAPNNVNTMACAALACHNIGMDKTIGRLVADTRLTTHEIIIEAEGKANPETGQKFTIRVARSSPAPIGAVTSKATYGTFLESLLRARGRGKGVHFV